jgi:hypothetical protein
MVVHNADGVRNKWEWRWIDWGKQGLQFLFHMIVEAIRFWGQMTEIFLYAPRQRYLRQG